MCVCTNPSPTRRRWQDPAVQVALPGLTKPCITRPTAPARGVGDNSYDDHTTTSTSSETPTRCILNCILSMLNILSLILSDSRCLLRSTPNIHSIFGFSDVEHTFSNTFQRQIPPQKHPQDSFYTLFFVCWAYFVQNFPTAYASRIHSILYFSYVEHTFSNTFSRQAPPQKHPHDAFYIVFFVCWAYCHQ